MNSIGPNYQIRAMDVAVFQHELPGRGITGLNLAFQMYGCRYSGPSLHGSKSLELVMEIRAMAENPRLEIHQRLVYEADF